MSRHHPIQTISELQFVDSIMGHRLGKASPDYLRFSPNGRYISIGCSGGYYLFDTQDPEQSWKKGAVKKSLSMVSPTDAGACWIEKDSSILYVNADRHIMLNLTMSQFDRMWGNDNWLLIANSDELHYAPHPNFSFGADT